MIYNIIGLAFDLVGVLLLFRFGILPDNLWNHILMDGEMSEKDERRHKLCSKIAIILIFVGFSLQLFGSLNQYKPNNSNPENKVYEIRVLGIDKNITSGIIGDLRVKYGYNKLSYQLELKGLTSSFSNVTNFWINLEDKDGFRITEIDEENKTGNLNASRLYSNDSLYLTIKNTIPYSTKDYSQIEKWNLKISK